MISLANKKSTKKFPKSGYWRLYQNRKRKRWNAQLQVWVSRRASFLLGDVSDLVSWARLEVQKITEQSRNQDTIRNTKQTLKRCILSKARSEQISFLRETSKGRQHLQYRQNGSLTL